MRKVLLRGTIGAIPGLLVALVPLVLHEFDVISSDQSQIGFVGVPILFVGVVIGVVGAAAETDRTGSAALGLAAGFAIGLAVGLALASVLAPLIWLFTTPAAMIVGGAAATSAFDEDERDSRGGHHHGARPRHA
jgi:Ca2+/H+ antiporter